MSNNDTDNDIDYYVNDDYNSDSNNDIYHSVSIFYDPCTLQNMVHSSIESFF